MKNYIINIKRKYLFINTSKNDTYKITKIDKLSDESDILRNYSQIKSHLDCTVYK